MNAWALKRKRIILTIVCTALVVIIGVPGYFILKPVPSCTDNKMNGDETGVDCGGSCTILCGAQSLPMITKGDARVLEVEPGEYEVVAVEQNPNLTADVFRANYTFTLYAEGSTTPLKVVNDATYIPPNLTFGVFAGPFLMSSTTPPTRATFAWSDASLVWRKNAYKQPDLSFSGTVLSGTATGSRLDATIQNNSLTTALNIELVGLVSDTNGNIVAASKTLVETLGTGATSPIVFTWPFALASSTSAEILPRALPDPSFIR